MSRFTIAHFLESFSFPFHISVHRMKKDMPRHSHEFVELVYVRKGRCLHTYRDEQFPISEGDVFVIEPEAEHAYRLTDEREFEVYNVLFHPSFLAHEFKALSEVDSFVDFFYIEPFMRNSVLFQSRLSLSVAQQAEADFMLRRLLDEFKRTEPGYRFLVKTKLIEILVFLSRCYSKNKRNVAAPNDDQAYLQQVCDFIEAHCEKELTLEQMSRMCGLGSTAFSVKFKRHTGRTFLEFRNEMRVERAKRLLKDASEKIIIVAKEAGFNDISHFNRTFKQWTGLTPKQFRQQQKEK